MYRKKDGYGNFSHGMLLFLLFLCMHFWVWGILLRRSVCAPIAYEAVRNCEKFKKHFREDLQVDKTPMFRRNMHLLGRRHNPGEQHLVLTFSRVSTLFYLRSAPWNATYPLHPWPNVTYSPAHGNSTVCSTQWDNCVSWDCCYQETCMYVKRKAIF